MQHSLLIDVRSPSEYASGHKQGAINLDVRAIAAGTLPDTAKDTLIELYCASGARSGLAKTMLEAHGFTNVRNVGGYSG